MHENWWARGLRSLVHRFRRWIDSLLSKLLQRRPAKLVLKFHPISHYSVYEGKLMQQLTKEGSRVTVSAVDADGLPIGVPGTPAWSAVGDFVVTPAADGLSATLVPGGSTSTGTVTVAAGDLSVTADIGYTSTAPVERAAVKLNLAFATIPPAAEPPPADATASPPAAP